MKVGILITMFDKWEEVSILIDIIRSWKGDYTIGLTCNHPDGAAFAKAKGVDLFTASRDIKFESRPWGESTFYFDQNVNFMLRIRIHYAIMQGCKAMTNKTDCDFIIHTHADGWFMSEDKMLTLIETMATKNKAIALRGTGLGDIYRPYTSNTAFGQADDHFFVFERKFAKKRQMWEYLPEDMLMKKHSIHGTLMNVFAVKSGFSNMWYYKKHDSAFDAYGRMSIDNEVKPCLFDPDYGLLHVHRGSLPDDWGKKLQTYYIINYSDYYNKVLSIRQFCNDNYTNSRIIEDIRKANHRLDVQLKWRLFPKKIINKTRITYKQLLLDHFTLSTLLNNIKRRFFIWLVPKVYPEKDVVKVYRDTLHLHDLVGDNWSDDWE